MKVYPFQIPKPLHQNLIVQEDKAIQFYNQLHQHAEIQLSLLISGKGKLLVGDSIHPFYQGDFFVIGANSPHLFNNEKTKDEAHMLSLFFTNKTFGNSFFELPDLEEIRPFFEMAKDGFQVVSEVGTIKKMMLQTFRSDKLDRFIYFLQLLKKLCGVEKRPPHSILVSKENRKCARQAHAGHF